MKILSKLLMIILVVVMLLNVCANTIYATVELTLNKAYVKTIGTADYHLKYYIKSEDRYGYYRTILAGYEGEDGTTYPAYCLDRALPGNEEKSYYVTIDEVLDNDAIWRIIKNGYPYKKAKDFGLEDDYDAYVITKFAIYCVLGQTKLEYFKAEDDDKVAKKMLK